MMRCRRSTFSLRPRRSAEGRPHDAVEVPNARRRHARGGHPRGAGDRAPDLSDALAAQCLLPRAPSQSLGLLSRVAPRRGDRRLCRALEDERRGAYHHRRRARQSTGQGVRSCPDGGADPARLPIGLALAHARGAAAQPPRRPPLREVRLQGHRSSAWLLHRQQRGCHRDVVGLHPSAGLQEAVQRDPANARDRRARHQHTAVALTNRRILAIETSCDETAAAVIASGPRLLSNVVRSQDALHAPFGGVVPEIAARAHLQTLVPVIERALENAATRWEQVDAVAVTKGPGLFGGLLVGVNLAQAIAWARKLPVIGVSHLAAHVFAAQLEEAEVRPPVLGLVVSGGHSDLIRWQEDGNITVIGRTIDDAAGEAFDKGARILGLPFPGGPAIDALAAKGDPRAVRFPRPRAPGLDFSFSGVKTALLYEVRKRKTISEQERADLAAIYQEAIVDALLQRVEAAQAQDPAPTSVPGGGGARNRRLREAAQARLGHLARLIIPAPELCTDNAAMIGAAALIEWDRRGPDPAPFDADPSLGFA